jgi:hypothetical protein
MLKRYGIFLLAAFIVLGLGTAFAAKNVTFQVHMGIQMQLGQFTAGTDTLVMRGDFEEYLAQSNWAGTFFMLAKSPTNDSIYTITVPFPDSVAGKSIQYKFVKVNNGDTWEGVDNRTYAVTADANQTIPVVYFNNRTTVGVTHDITFQLDMTALKAAGFNDATDSIEVRGDTSPLNWGPGIRLTKSLLNPNLYQVKRSFTAAVGGTINYKFHADPEAKFDNTGWETGDNHPYVFADKDTIFTAWQPLITVKNVITANVTVTFNVNMTGAKERYHGTTITGLTGVYIAGGATPLVWPGSWLMSDTTAPPTGSLWRMTHTSGNTWSITLTFLASNNTSRNIEYKFGAVFPSVDTLNGGVSYLDNEAGFAQNHKLALDDVTGTQTVNDVFGGQVTSVAQDPTAGVPVSYSLSQNYPNPFNPSTNIRYTVPATGFVSLKVFNILGQEVASILEGQQNAGSYIATFDASKLTSGVYFYRLSGGAFSRTMKMVLLK